MKHRCLTKLAALAVALAAMMIGVTRPLSGQVPSTAKSWIPPLTLDGQPDLQGTWTNATITPLERPRELGDKAFFTPQEAAEYEKQVLEKWDRDRRDGGADADLARAYGSIWWDGGRKSLVVPSLRTSLIVDPPEGHVPALTAQGQARMNAVRAENRLHPNDGPEKRSLAERCLLWPTTGPPMLPSFYRNAPYGPLVTNYVIVQTSGYVVIFSEINHDARIIPLDSRPHRSPHIRQWLGDSLGHWEGETLVVETTNFTDKTNFQGADENMRLVERFSRTGPSTILYQFTVDDPTAFTRPWTAEFPDFACNEGNYGLTGMLSGARAEEKAAAEAAKGTSK
jgi:hypothetical protein